MKKIMLYIFFALLCLVIIAPAAFGSDNIQLPNHIYRVAIDQSGNMRLLSPDLNGRYADEPRSNEYVVELASIESVLSLQETLDELQDNVVNMEDRLTLLEDTVADFASGDIVADLEERLALLEEIVDNLSSGQPPANPSPVIDLASYVGNLPPDDEGNHTNVTWEQLDSGLWVMGFNGTSSYVSLPSPISMTDIYVSIWLKPTIEHSYRTFVDVGDLLISIRDFDQRVSVNREYSGGVVSDTPLAATWNHVGVAIDETSTSFYLNAVADGVQAATAYTAGVTNIGRYSGGAQYYDGQSALVRIYDYIPTEQQILDQHNAERALFGL